MESLQLIQALPHLPQPGLRLRALAAHLAKAHGSWTRIALARPWSRPPAWRAVTAPEQSKHLTPIVCRGPSKRKDFLHWQLLNTSALGQVERCTCSVNKHFTKHRLELQLKHGSILVNIKVHFGSSTVCVDSVVIMPSLLDVQET